MENRPVLLSQLTRVLAATPAQSPLPVRLCLAFTELVAAEESKRAGNLFSISLTSPYLSPSVTVVT